MTNFVLPLILSLILVIIANKVCAKDTSQPNVGGRPRPRPATVSPQSVSGASKSVPYLSDVKRRIKRAWFPPKHNEGAIVTVTFTVHGNGTISKVKLKKSSGRGICDQAALKAIENAAPFRPLPGEFPSKVIEVEMGEMEYPGLEITPKFVDDSI